uniref:Uncharacterized protein n=1 Tax=Lygus hesperus TaxID=30085 RepID=A0A0A9VNU6_LYGHE
MAASAPVEADPTPQRYFSSCPPAVPPPQFYEPMVRGSLATLSVDVASTPWAPPSSWPPPPQTPVYPTVLPHFHGPPTSTRPPPPRYPSIVAGHPLEPPPLRRRRTICLRVLSTIVILIIIIIVITIAFKFIHKNK